MAANFFALFDDIVTILDDVAVLSKMATQKTAGVIGDDLALNANQVNGVSAARELPVVWAVFKGSMLNKLILIPLALLISYFVPWLIIPLLMIGGSYLCYEGFEKIMHKLFHQKEEQVEKEQLIEAFHNNETDLVAYEKDKIKGAIKTDFILSAEIITLILGVVSQSSFLTQVLVLSAIGLGMTVGVYGIVALIVKLDDIGLWMKNKGGNFNEAVGNAILWSMPFLMKTLTFVGTAAMFLVGGGIIAHGIPVLHHLVEQAGSWGFAVDGVVGLLSGALLVMVMSIVEKFKSKSKE